jgi:hypothetical protein
MLTTYGSKTKTALAQTEVVPYTTSVGVTSPRIGFPRRKAVAGFEIYEGFESYRREALNRNEEEAAPAQRRLEVREVCDSLLQYYYAIKDAAAG